MQFISLYLPNSLERPVPALRRNCVLGLGPNALLWPGPGFQVASWSQQGCFSQEVLCFLWRWFWLSLRGKGEWTLPLHLGRLVDSESRQHSKVLLLPGLEKPWFLSRPRIKCSQMRGRLRAGGYSEWAQKARVPPHLLDQRRQRVTAGNGKL